MAIEIFRRKEQKYLITTAQYKELVRRMSWDMRNDLNGIDGRYTITSLYFESPDHKIYYETKNKLRFRQKLRLRVYDDTNIHGSAFFEVKQKHKKVVNKRRMVIPLEEAYRYLDGPTDIDLNQINTSNMQVLREIDHYKKLFNLQPEMIVSYDRHAFHGIHDDQLRVTFDLNLRCRNDNLALENGAYGHNFIDPDLVVLEVKVNDSVPLWLTRILQDLNCEQRGASKFCTSLEYLKQEELGNKLIKEDVSIGGVI